MTFINFNNPNLSNSKNVQTSSARAGYSEVGFGRGSDFIRSIWGPHNSTTNTQNFFTGGTYNSANQITVNNFGTSMPGPFSSFYSPFNAGGSCFGFGFSAYNGGLGRGVSRFGVSPILSPALYLTPETFVSEKKPENNEKT